MLTFHSLGVEEARAAISAGVAKAKENSVLMAFAVTDRAGDLIMCERMDGAPFRNLRHAMRKAYTSAIMGRDTVLFAQQLRERNGDLVQWGDAQLTTLAGGCVVTRDGEVLGAVACGGATGEMDVAVAQAMVAAALGV
jgi:glc operon protein GlcG